MQPLRSPIAARPAPTFAPTDIYWVGQKVHLAFSIKQETHCSFSPMTLLVWIFWVRQLSPTWHVVDCLQLVSWVDRCQPQLLPDCGASSSMETSQTTFDTFDQSQHFLHTLHRSFLLSFSCVFTFLEIIKHNMPKRLHIFFPLQYVNGYTKIHQF